MLKNVTRLEVSAFIGQVELVLLIGEHDEAVLVKQIRALSDRNPGVYTHLVVEARVERVQATEPLRLTLDTAGYFVIYPELRTRRLFVEHYTNQGVLDCVMEGSSTGALYSEAIRRNLLTRLDHAAYLGRELARAEQSILQGISFVQDAAPGLTTESNCGCQKGCCE
jgi:tetrahydromethanopterin S-methyltransferase subunit A